MADADTAAKRAAALGFGLTPGVVLPIPDGTVSAQDRAQLLGGFMPLGAGSDTTPDQFTFTDQFNVPTSSTRTSNGITVTGIDAAAAISISNGTYSINGAAYTASAGTVVLNDVVTVRHTASGVASTTVDTVLTIDSISDTFSSTTASAGGTASFAPIAALIQRRQFN